MSNLEKLARVLYDRYCKREHNKRGYWMYLSDKRKAVWMGEVLLIADHILDELEKDIKHVGNTPRGVSSFVMGQYEALRSERIVHQRNLINIHEQLHDDLEDFLKPKKRKR